MKVILVVFVAINLIVVLGINSVFVEIDQGVIQGEELALATGRGTYYSFKGIPYAEPPIKDLRFKAPKPPLPWEGVRNANVFGSKCVQYETISDASPTIVGDEDCLYLNVYTPNLYPVASMVVIVVIPGGYFITGSGNDDIYGPDFLMSYDIVLVTINYRLGPLGFLSLDTEEVPGNAGLKDQIAALKWVKKNIAMFGGDPLVVTIYGQGAGAASVSLHLISPAANNLFRRAISTSGVFTTDWSTPFKPRRRAFALGRKLGLSTTDPYILTEFLRSIPAERLFETNPRIMFSDDITTKLLRNSYYTPVTETLFGPDQYLTENPIDLLRKGEVNVAQLLMGHTVNEGMRNVGLFEKLILGSFPEFFRLLIPSNIANVRSPKQVEEYSNIVYDYYFGNRMISNDTLKEIIDIFSFSNQVHPIHEYVEALRKSSLLDIYFFHFDVYSSRNLKTEIGDRLGIKQATFEDDLPYLFYGKTFNLTIDIGSEEFKYVDKVCKLFTNFAKYGNPTPDNNFGITWIKYDGNMKYLNIGDVLEEKQAVGYHHGQIKFWRDIYEVANVDLRELWDNSFGDNLDTYKDFI